MSLNPQVDASGGTKTILFTETSKEAPQDDHTCDEE